MKQFPLDLGTGSAPGRDKLQGGSRHINCYLEARTSDSKTQKFINVIPGLTRWDAESYPGQARALQKISDNALYALLGNQVVKFSADAVASVVGSIPGTGRVYAAQNMRTTNQVGFVTGDNQFWLMESDAVARVTDADLPAPNSIAFLDGYFILTIPDGRFFWTALNDGTDIDALDFVTAESNADGLVVGIDHRGEYYAFGRETFEIWRNTGVSGNEFQPVQQDSEFGIMAGHTLKKIKKGLIWVDHNGLVQFMIGADPVEVSNSDVVRAIHSLTDAQKEAMEADVEVVADQEFYILNSEAFTWAWSAKTGTWHERTSQGYDRSIRNVHEFFAGKHIFGSTIDGALYTIDDDSYSEAGLDLIMRVIPPNLNAFPNSIRCSMLKVDAVTGVGLNSATLSDSSPQLMLRWSDDGQYTWSNTKSVDLGTMGNRNTELIYRKLGRIGKTGRNFELSASARVCRSIMNVFVEGDVIR